eukprot:CAMPEP_0194313682 /NCGR_PEP_ID=MMETSP0171-20130528/10544_1 /TAXON_ID=218684 /ORGANISM="Corethron pennatum, Strain L29A3" /LENGTH=549 /DNA_ID=CAMNT_0039068745 /DNA_START=198 /DNA_END=1844 /DNA_ORIENTATION=+
MVASEEQSGKKVTAWSYNPRYKKSSALSSNDELLEKSFICFGPDGKIITRNEKDITKNTESFTEIIDDIWKGKNVIHAVKLDGGYSARKEEVLIALREVEKKENTFARIEFELSQLLQQDKEHVLTTEQECSRGEWPFTKNSVQINDTDSISLKANFENTETFNFQGILGQNEQNSASLLKEKESKDFKISEMRREFAAAQLESCRAGSRAKTLIEKVLAGIHAKRDLGQTVGLGDSIASVLNLRPNQDLQDLRCEYSSSAERYLEPDEESQGSRCESSRLETSTMVKDDVKLETESKISRGNINSETRKQKMKNDQLIAQIIKEKENAVALAELKIFEMEKEQVIKEKKNDVASAELKISQMKKEQIIKEKENAVASEELKISEMKKELDALKGDCFQTSNHVKDLKETITKLENQLAENSIALKSNSESELELKNDKEEEIAQLEEELKKMKTTITLTTEKLKKCLIANKSIASVVKEKDDALVAMKLRVYYTKKKLHASKKESIKTCSHNKSLKEEVFELKKGTTEKICSPANFRSEGTMFLLVAW